ncbi:unnamed protein product [Tenebrio molitor]|jgi:hypothetical protein|nr:unnamed protein product [Tenebrio molitor]
MFKALKMLSRRIPEMLTPRQKHIQQLNSDVNVVINNQDAIEVLERFITVNGILVYHF